MPPRGPGALEAMFGLSGRRALVTGGSSGIGRAIAVGLAAAGAEVHLVGRDARRLEDAAGTIEAAGGTASFSACDLADRAALDTFLASAEVAEADILVAAAAVNPRPPLDQIDRALYAEAMHMNVDVPFRLVQAAAPRMAARGWGRVIHLGSQQSWSAFGRSGVYGVSKAAVGGMTRSQAERWGPDGVTVNCLVPGFVRTAMTEDLFANDPDRARAMAERTMVGRNGTAEDLAGAAVSLASPSAAYITGQMIAVDGGFSVH